MAAMGRLVRRQCNPKVLQPYGTTANPFLSNVPRGSLTSLHLRHPASFAKSFRLFTVMPQDHHRLPAADHERPKSPRLDTAHPVSPMTTAHTSSEQPSSTSQDTASAELAETLKQSQRESPEPMGDGAFHAILNGQHKAPLFSFVYTLMGGLRAHILNAVCRDFGGESAYCQTLEEGATHAANAFLHKLAEHDWASLQQFTDPTLLSTLQSLLTPRNGLCKAPSLSPVNVPDSPFALDALPDRSDCTKLELGPQHCVKSQIIKLRMLRGGARGAQIGGRLLRNIPGTFGTIQVLAPQDLLDIPHLLMSLIPALPPPTLQDIAETDTKGDSNINPWHDTARAADINDAGFSGGILRLDMLCHTIHKPNSVRKDRERKKHYHYHYLRFEAPFMRQEEETGRFVFRRTDGWALVDFNFLLRGNYPYQWDNVTDRETLHLIQEDCQPPRFWSAQQPQISQVL